MILLCFIISKIILKILKRIINRFPLDPSIQIFIMTGLKVLLVFISTIIITEYLGVPTTSLVALLSVVSLAVSLSIQGLLSNVAGASRFCLPGLLSWVITLNWTVYRAGSYRPV